MFARTVRRSTPLKSMNSSFGPFGTSIVATRYWTSFFRPNIFSTGALDSNITFIVPANPSC